MLGTCSEACYLRGKPHQKLWEPQVPLDSRKTSVLGYYEYYTSSLCPCSLQGSWNRWPLKVPPKSKASKILWIQVIPESKYTVKYEIYYVLILQLEVRCRYFFPIFFLKLECFHTLRNLPEEMKPLFSPIYLFFIIIVSHSVAFLSSFPL